MRSRAMGYLQACPFIEKQLQQSSRDLQAFFTSTVQSLFFSALKIDILVLRICHSGLITPNHPSFNPYKRRNNFPKGFPRATVVAKLSKNMSNPLIANGPHFSQNTELRSLKYLLLAAETFYCKYIRLIFRMNE